MIMFIINGYIYFILLCIGLQLAWTIIQIVHDVLIGTCESIRDSFKED